MSERDPFLALFEPRGIVVAGASTHPGKFGFVALHNILSAGYQGKVFATNREGTEVLGVPTVADVDDLPDGEIDLVFVCTPAAANPALLTGLCRQRHPGRLRGLGRVPGGRPRGSAGRGRPGRPRGRVGDPAGGPQRPGSHLHAGGPLCADRRPLSAGRPHRHRQPVGQLRVVVHELGPALRHRREPGRQRRQLRGGRRARLPRVLCPRPGDRRRPVLRRGHRGRPRVLRPHAAASSPRSPSWS